jgi:hypothetical protein
LLNRRFRRRVTGLKGAHEDLFSWGEVGGHR